MASAALTELTKLVGEKDAARLYNAIVGEYTQHVRKHLDAAKVEAPEKATEADFVEADPDRRLTEVIGEEMEKRARG